MRTGLAPLLLTENRREGRALVKDIPAALTCLQAMLEFSAVANRYGGCGQSWVETNVKLEGVVAASSRANFATSLI